MRHAKRSEKVSRSARSEGSWPALLAPVLSSPAPACLSPAFRTSISTTPPASARSRLDRFREAAAQVLLHHQPVDDDRDVVLVLLVELDALVKAPDLAVDPGAAVALEAELLELLLVLALAPADDGRADDEPRSLGQRHHAVGDLLDRLPLDRLAALGAVRVPDPRPEQAQVVVDLGHRADGRARVARGGLLVDRDRRRQPLDRVDVRLLHQTQELARVGGERLDVAPLALGVDRVEGEARLAGPREAGHDDHRVARKVEVDALEVVLAGTGDDYAIRGRHWFDCRAANRCSLRLPSDRK